MKKFIKEITINTAEELFRELSVTGKYKDLIGNFLFRGHEDEDWELLPSIFRENVLKLLFSEKELYLEAEEYSLERFHFLRVIRERGLVYDFYKEASQKGLEVLRIEDIENYKRNQDDLMNKELYEIEPIEWMKDVNIEEICALCQHYDLPTRLLDWSGDIYVAIYFAVQDIFNKNKKINKEKNIAIWAFDFEKIKMYNSYCTDLNENIQYRNQVSEGDKNKVNKKNYSKYNEEIKLKNKKVNLDNFNSKEFDNKNLEIYKYNMKVKKYNFEIGDDNYQKLKEYKKFLIPVYSVVPPYYANANINAQKGVLLYQKTLYSALEEGESLFDFNKKQVAEWENSEEYRVFKLSLDELIDRYLSKDIFEKLEMDTLFYKFLIPQEETLNIMEYLYKLEYDAAKIFPGYQSITKKILEQKRIYNKEV